jgi:hypothetical protein
VQQEAYSSEEASSSGVEAWRGGKGHDGHTGMAYSRVGMQHQCQSFVQMDTEGLTGGRLGTPPSYFKEKGNHQRTNRVMVRALSHVL